MVKAAVSKKPTAPVAQDEIERSLAVLSARKQFFSAATSMGWQLAGMVLVPVVIGVKLDDHFHATPSYTLAALVLAIGGGVWVVNNTIKQVNKEQAETDKEEKSQ